MPENCKNDVSAFLPENSETKWPYILGLSEIMKWPSLEMYKRSKLYRSDIFCPVRNWYLTITRISCSLFTTQTIRLSLMSRRSYLPICLEWTSWIDKVKLGQNSTEKSVLEWPGLRHDTDIRLSICGLWCQCDVFDIYGVFDVFFLNLLYSVQLKWLFLWFVACGIYDVLGTA